jgi:hypothetical protein
MFSSCFIRKHQRNGIRAYQKRKARGLFLKETLAKHVSLMLFPWETGLGASSAGTPLYSALPNDIGSIRLSIDQMLELKLGPSPQQTPQNLFDPALSDQMFSPFEFIVRKKLARIENFGNSI